MNGLFACQNLGYIVQYSPASRVNDGICDCCDGSDEYDSGTVCENKCVALAAQMRAEEDKARELRNLGLAKRKELVSLGTELKKSIKDQLIELEKNKQANQAHRSQLEGKQSTHI
jgi:protein kinase C substrate 80K-H